MLRRSLALLLLVPYLVLPAAQARQLAQPESLAITHVTVIDVAARDARRALIPDQTIIVTGNRITAVGMAGRVRVPAGAQVIDAAGKFLIPGLWDMHAHTLGSRRRRIFFPLFVANGVTGVRDMAAFIPLEQAKLIRREIADGRLLGPRFVTPGPLIDGPKPAFPDGSIGVASEAEARRVVRLLKGQGADFIKVYNFLPREAYFALADEAKRQGLTLAGHVPLSVTAAEASRAGHRSMEHLLGVREGSALGEAGLRRDALKGTMTGGLMRSQVNSVATYDGKRAAELFNLFAKNQTWQVPTLTFWHSVSFYDESSATYAGDPRLKYMYPELLEGWRLESPESEYKGFVEDYAAMKRLFPEQLKIVGEMHRAGVPILAGTDVAVPYVFPGFSLHEELGWFVKAGLTPLAALRTATLNPAKFLGREKELGTIEKGKLADLVLLDADPLDDIGNTRKINAVVLNGRLFDRKALDVTLAQAEAAANRK